VSGVGNRHLAGGAAAACAVCCAAPLVGFLGVAGFAATAVTFAFAGVVFALVVGVATAAALLVRRSRARQVACAPPSEAGAVPVELGHTRVGE
jgi:MFS superfamily sulfate permease-like transporter